MRTGAVVLTRPQNVYHSRGNWALSRIHLRNDPKIRKSHFPSFTTTAGAGEEWALACADPEPVRLFSGRTTAQSSIRIEFCDMTLVRVTVSLGGVMSFLLNDCIAVFPILAGPVDVKKADQQCNTMSQPSIHPDKVNQPKGT